MSKPRVQLQATVDTFTHAETIVSAISNRLIGKDIFEVHNLSAGVDDFSATTSNLVSFDFRLNRRVDRDDIKDWIKDQIQNHPSIKTWVTSAKMSWHECSHSDTVVKNCRTTGYFDWSK